MNDPTNPYLESARVITATGETCADSIRRAATLCVDAIRRGNKIMICGNGGSMAEACHMAAELVVRLRSGNDRRALPAVALGTNPAVVTACGNDYSFEGIFAREVEAIGREDDILVCLSTSGKSPNIKRAMRAAWDKKVHSILISGDLQRPVAHLMDTYVGIEIPSTDTARIQEATLVVIHELCRMIEEGVCDER
jgi:phosphoheptose isomerase